METDRDPLSPRLVDVLHLIADGRTTDEIARILELSPHTVKNYVERILDRLNARDRVQAVAIALRQGILN